METRVTPWVDVTSRPEWAGTKIAGYRIWQQTDGRRWWQRHEWTFRGRNSTELEDWISGVTDWLPHAIPCDDDGNPRQT